MRFFRPPFILLFLLLPVLSALAQGGNSLRFQHIGRAQGLSSDDVRVLLQDQRGFLWIGTEDGLNLYDGNSVTVFHFSRHDSTTICDDQLYSLSEDAEGYIWAGTGNGVCRIDPHTRKALRVTFSSTAADAFNTTSSSKIFVDAENRVWLGNAGGLGLYDKKENRFRKIPLFENGKPAQDFIASFFDAGAKGKSDLWIGTYNGLVHLDNPKGSISRYIPLLTEKENIITSISAAGSGKLAISTWGAGFGEFSIAAKSFRLYTWDSTSANRSAVNIAYCSAWNGTQSWFGTNAGLFIAPPGAPAKAIVLQHDNNEQGSIASSNINCILYDRDGNTWLGTSAGISVTLKTHERFKLLPQPRGFVTKMLFEPDSTCWVSAWYGDGWQQFDKHFNLLQQFKHVPTGNTELNTGQISDMIHARSGLFWIATFSGLCAYDPATKTFKRFLHDSISANSLPSNRLNGICEDQHGRLWIATYGKGLSCFDPSTGNFKNFQSVAGDSTSLSTDLVWGFYEDKARRIWALLDNGVARYDDATGKFHTITNIRVEDEKQSIGIGMVLGMAETPNGSLWIGSSGGLFELQPSGQWKFYSTEDGLVSKTVHGLLADNSGNLWITTVNGLSCYLPAQKKFINYTIEKGMPVNKLDAALSSDLSGRLYVGGESRMFTFDPRELLKEGKQPLVFFTRLLIAGHEQEFPSDSEQVIRLDYDQNDLQFEFTSPDFDAALLQQYAYSLSGDWTLIGNRRNISFANLAPGDYRLRIKAANSDGVWSAARTLHLVILPPFWRTWWFYTLVFITVLLGVVLIVRYISQRKLREQILRLEKEQAIERERNRISKDMHDDLGSGLTKIAILSEVVKRKMNNPEEAGKQIDSISGSARELVDNLNEIIWALNPGNDNLENLAAYIREFAYKIFEAYEVRLQFHFPETIPAIHLTEEQRRNIFLVTKETYHNILKHAQCTEVTTTLAVQGKQVTLSIHDNGRGFDPATIRQFANGLKNMQKRMETAGGRFTISSTPGEGTTVTLSMQN